MSKTIGILGGMGPEATVRIFSLIVEKTKARKDQDHIPVIIINNPKIPDRTEAILGKGESPLPLLVASAKLLESSGADFIIMPCNTAHHYYDKILKHINIPLLHLHDETLKYVVAKFKGLKRLGLLATTGTVETDLFQNIFPKKGFEIINPDARDQQQVMESLFGKNGIKAGFKGHSKELLLKVIAKLKIEKKIEAIISGCTDISLVLKNQELGLPVIDPLEIIAEVAITRAGYTVK